MDKDSFTYWLECDGDEDAVVLSLQAGSLTIGLTLSASQARKLAAELIESARALE